MTCLSRRLILFTAGSIFITFIGLNILPLPIYAASTSINFDSSTITAINQIRTANHVTALSVNLNLIEAAHRHNVLMYKCAARHGITPCFLHQVLPENEPTLMERITVLQYHPIYVSENIAWGFTTPSALINGWLNSPGHKANILSPKAHSIGCDYLDGNNGDYRQIFWTCDFGDSSNLPAQSTRSVDINNPTQVNTRLKINAKPSSSPSLTIVTTSSTVAATTLLQTSGMSHVVSQLHIPYPAPSPWCKSVTTRAYCI